MSMHQVEPTALAAVLTVGAVLIAREVESAARLLGGAASIAAAPNAINAAPLSALSSAMTDVPNAMIATPAAPQCRTCSIHQVCGGGQYSHRHRSGSGFANPWVYCLDLMKLIRHIAAVIREDVCNAQT
jgi:uncharacterized protein